MQDVKVRALFTPPTILEDLLQEDGAMKKAATLDFALFAGGPLAKSAGDKLIKATEVYQFTGSTEIGIIPTLIPEPRENWIFFEWHPEYQCKMEEIGDNTFELVFPRDDSLGWIRGRCFPDRLAPEWRTRDTYKPHPTTPGVWRFHGRTDDIIVLSNGEKFNPVTQEGIIQGHPLLSGALITGQGRTQPALLVEVRKCITLTSQEIIDQIWLSVDLANSAGPAHGRVFRSKILVTTPDRMFEQVGKRTVKRQETLERYKPDFFELYEGPATNGSSNRTHLLKNPQDPSSYPGFLRTSIKLLLQVDIKVDDADFF